jgi:serine/threonine protein kinase
MEDLIGKQLGPYQIVDQLGAGGMATVFKAYQPKMKRYVALKILPRFFSKNPEFVRRFSQEAHLIAQLEHLHILPVYDFGESDGYTYLAMRLVKGGSLSNLLEKHGRLELDKINHIITQVGEALDYAHKKNIIHRDAKPGNVLIDEFGNCLLTDFGIAKILETTSNLTHTGGILGTPTYVSPEQGLGKPIDSRSDIYSLGVMLYHMIVGDVPYKADTPMAVVYKHIHDPLPLPRKQMPELPESVERVVLKALAKNPDDRYSTVSELVKDLQSAIDQFDAQIKEARESDSDFKTTGVVRAIPADEKKLPTKPPVELKPGIIKPKEFEEKRALPEPRRLWAYAVLAIILLVMFAGAGWFYYNNIFLSEPILSVESNPSGADVYVNGGHVGVSPVRVDDLMPGTHKIRVSKDRYQDYKEDLFIKKGKSKVIQAELTPKPFGDLEVNSNPSGAEVYIDDDKRGITPIAFKNLPKGTRKVMVKKEGFDTWLGTVEIVPLEKAHMSADLVSIFGGLNISSNPSEADVYIGGKKKGKTPLILEKVKKGQQKIEIKKNGFDVWKDDVTVKSSEMAKVHVNLRAVIVSPKATSAPSGAIVSLADKKKLELEHQRLEDEKRLLEERKRLEAEQKRLEQERQELERIKAEIEERKRLEAEKQALEEKKALEEKIIQKKPQSKQLAYLPQLPPEIQSNSRLNLAIFPFCKRNMRDIIAKDWKEFTSFIINFSKNIPNVILTHSFYPYNKHKINYNLISIEPLINEDIQKEMWYGNSKFPKKKPDFTVLKKLAKQISADLILTFRIVSQDAGPIRIKIDYNGYLIDIDKNIFYERKIYSEEYSFPSVDFDIIKKITKDIFKFYLSSTPQLRTK